MKKSKIRMRKANVNVKLTMLIVGFFFVLIILKLSYVVLSNKVDGIDLTEFANNRNTVKETLYASRGVIYDRDGKPLAKNANSYKIIAMLSPSRTTDERYPQHVIDKEGTAEAMCNILAETDEGKKQCQSDLVGYFSQDLYQAELGIWGRVSEDKKMEIQNLDLPGITFETLAKKRQYINSSWASYILGYARSNDEGEIVGEMGIESYFDKELKGKNGYTEYQQDAYGYRMPTSEVYEEEAIPGDDIYLTINTDVQNILENAVANFSKDVSLSWVTFTVMNAKTGEILGSASNPNFNPNTLENLNNYLNPLVGYQYEPGSTMKIFSWLASLENGIYNGSELYQSGTAVLSDGSTKIKDFNAVGWGKISYDLGFAYSSNVAATNLALKLGTAKLTDFYNKMGFGEKTKITLPGEAEGLINFQYESELANASFGQGVLVTPVQMLQAMTIFANDGVMVRPHIVSKMVDANGNVTETKREEIGKVVSSESINKMKQLMYDVVYNGFSYNKLYAPNNVKIGGKTGTAQIASPNGGYLTGAYDYIRSFIGFFPYDDPEYVFYFATEKYVGDSNNIATTVASSIKDIANMVEATEEENDVDESKIVTVEQLVSSNVTEVAEELKKLGLNPIVLGNGKFVVNQYPKEKTKVIVGLKIFLKTNGTEFKMVDMTGWSTNEAIRFCNMVGLSYTLNGYGTVKSFSIPKDTVITTDMNLEITLEP